MKIMYSPTADRILPGDSALEVEISGVRNLGESVTDSDLLALDLTTKTGVNIPFYKSEAGAVTDFFGVSDIANLEKGIRGKYYALMRADQCVGISDSPLKLPAAILLPEPKFEIKPEYKPLEENKNLTIENKANASYSSPLPKLRPKTKSKPFLSINHNNPLLLDKRERRSKHNPQDDGLSTVVNGHKVTLVDCLVREFRDEHPDKARTILDPKYIAKLLDSYKGEGTEFFTKETPDGSFRIQVVDGFIKDLDYTPKPGGHSGSLDDFIRSRGY